MENEKLLTLQNLKTMIRAISPNEQSEIVSKYLKNKIIIHNNDCYIINDDVVYDIETDCENKILSTVSKLILDSYKNLNDVEKEDLKELKNYDKIFKNPNTRSYYPQLVSSLTRNDIKFDIYFSIVHFKNGFYNLENKTFSKRNLGEHFITKCISYDYVASTIQYRNIIFKELSKIYPNETVLNTILTIISSALTGLSNRDTYLLFLIGDASAGKSSILDITKFTVECYVKQIKPDTFVEGKNTDKIVNTYHKCPFIRITWLNEPKDKKFDSTFIKSWADGECNAERLYKEGSHDFRHFSLTFFTANNMPNVQIDGGVARRIRAYEHKSKFVDNKNDVNEDKNIYLKNSDFKNNFNESIDLKLAFFDILAEFANKWLKNKKIDLPEEFKETANDIIDSNDHIKDFVDDNFTITKNEDDRIHKLDMLNFFNKIYPNKFLKDLQLIRLMKEKGVKYDRQKRCNGKQGSFYCIKFKEEDDENNDNNDYDHGVTKKDLSIKLSLDEEIEHYKKLVHDLELKRINEWNQSKPKQKTVTKTTIPTIKKSIVDEKCDNIKKLFESYN